MFFWFCIAAVIGYALGYYDGRHAKPPDPLRGNYPHCQDVEEQDKEYPTDWR